MSKNVEHGRIPTTKVSRAMKFVTTGAKVGRNYIKHYSKKAINPNLDKGELHTDNASDIYQSLSELKGSALKVAQMLAMDKNILPKAYQEKFVMAQYSAPPLSYPLVVQTFIKTLGTTPAGLFDEFSKSAEQAASMGQVHKARKGTKTYAVKVQYPGVGDSVKSDLRLVKPFATRLLNMSDRDLDLYFDEVESKLLEETDYALELLRSLEITRECEGLKDIAFPQYYPSMSSSRILTMDWIDGDHLKEFLQSSPSQETRDRVGQALWDFYDFQIHHLQKVHADPHPGNFIIGAEAKLHVIDFGCVKEIPDAFYKDYFGLLKLQVGVDEKELVDTFRRLSFLLPTDSESEVQLFTKLFSEMIELIGRPFRNQVFDFADDSFFSEIYSLSERISKMEEVRNTKAARGSRHGLYINRTYFGLYNLLNMLGAKVTTRVPDFKK